jgi:hypothetical protein
MSRICMLLVFVAVAALAGCGGNSSKYVPTTAFDGRVVPSWYPEIESDAQTSAEAMTALAACQTSTATQRDLSRCLFSEASLLDVFWGLTSELAGDAARHGPCGRELGALKRSARAAAPAAAEVKPATVPTTVSALSHLQRTIELSGTTERLSYLAVVRCVNEIR